MSDLKPCPFCGGEPVVVVRGALSWVCCSSPPCRARGKATYTPESAAAAWNTRVPCPECDRQRERANDARCREESALHSLNARFALQSELARLLGCDGLEGDDQLRVALERAKALVGVAEAARALQSTPESADALTIRFLHENLQGELAALAALDTPNTESKEDAE